MKLRAPYNFIPLAKDVFLPDWDEKISFERPFEDGLSGVIDVTLTARSPIFVRNGLSKMVVTDDDRRSISQNDYNRFNHIKDSEGNLLFFIPGSSVKGMLRSTIEIISDGKFAQIENQSFGKRNLNDSKYRNNMQNASCGWMYVGDDGGWKIDDHGKAMKVNVALLDPMLPDLMKHIKDRDALKRDENKTSMAKYKMLLDKGETFRGVDFYDDFISPKLNVTYKIGKITTSRHEEVNAVVSVNGNNDDKEGTVVLTGQQGAYDPKRFPKPGKHHEFIFPDKCVKEALAVADNIVEAFKTIHANSDDWTGLWADQLLLRNQRIPVFFSNDDHGNVTSIGLASMYKYPYKKSVHEANIPKEHLDARPDLAECMFGYCRQQDGELVALKGRVQVGHFFVTECRGEQDPHKLILGTPHPSYYPLYVQDGKTWDEAVEVNGRKFYPIRKENVTEQLPKDDKVVVEENGIKKLSKSAIAMCPLAAGTVFTGKIRFFNLKPFELGALVAALTFFDKPGHYHSIGMGKPLGYGKTEVTINKIECIRNAEPDKDLVMTTDECIDRFKCERFAAWEESEAAKELFAMASENESVDSYMVMTTDAKTDEFRLLKESRGLPRFSKLVKLKGEYEAEVLSVKKSRKHQDEYVRYGLCLSKQSDITVVSRPFLVKENTVIYSIKDKVTVHVNDKEEIDRVYKLK